MAYFDSPKNRAIWEKELTSLRAEKERRAQNGYKPTEQQQKTAAADRKDNPFRRRISLQELEEMELRERRKTKERAPQRSAKSASREKAPLRKPESQMGPKGPAL